MNSSLLTLRFRSLIVLTFQIFLFELSWAQKSEIHKVRAGQNIIKTFPGEIRYKHVEFKKGNVYFNYGSSSAALLNYDYLTGQILFIDSRSDTSAIAQDYTISKITFDSSFFLYCHPHGFLEVVEGSSAIKLAKKTAYKPLGAEKISAYEQPTASSSI